MQKRQNIFLNDKFILLVILVNAVIIFLQESGIHNPLISAIDIICTIIFIIEMVAKIANLGLRGYLSKGMNVMDGTLVLLSLPSVVSYFFPYEMLDLSFLLVLRVLRMFRFFRVVHFFPNFGTIMRNFGKAMKDSLSVFAGFIIMIIVVSLISCALFRSQAPQFFGTPADSIYSVFRMCTVEGWYEIPDTICEGLSPTWAVLVRVYFVLVLVLGGIIGMSLVNSIFVDAMVSDNNDALEKEVALLSRKMDALMEAQGIGAPIEETAEAHEDTGDVTKA